MQRDGEVKIREAIVEGLFYPEKAEELRASVTNSLSAASGVSGAAPAIASPHGSFDRCGEIIASAFRAAERRRIERVVLIGPVHREETDAVILPESSFFKTPLGELAVDVASVAELLTCGTHFVQNDIPHLEEHCLEVQLPFIQTCFPRAEIIPILLGKVTKANVKSLTQGLTVVFGERTAATLYVVTANFSIPRDGKGMGKKSELEDIYTLAAGGNWEALVEGKIDKRFHSCGAGCLAAVTALSLGKLRLIANKISPYESSTANGVEYAALAVE